MAKVKGKAKLNKAISAPLRKRFGIHKALLGDEFVYDFETENIGYKLTVDIEDDLFSEFIYERFGYDDTETHFLMSLLHEVGHHKANDEIDGAIYDFCIAEKQRIVEEMEYADSDYSKVLEWQYFNLPDEIMATQWAVNYAITHPNAVKRMNSEMLSAITEFYKVNRLEGA